jgi:protein NEDD1
LKSSKIHTKIKLEEECEITSLVFSFDSTYLFYSTSKGNIYTTLVNKNPQTQEYTSSNLTSSNSYSINKPEKLIFSNYFKIRAIKVSPFFNNLLAVGLDSGSLKLLDVLNYDVKQEFKEVHSDAITGISFSPINKMLLVTVGLDCKINFFDVILNKHIKTFETNYPILCLCFYLDGKTIACGGVEGIFYK